MRVVTACLVLAGLAMAAGACRRGAVPADADAGPRRPSGSTDAAATGCHVNADCRDDQYCAFQPGLCGKGQKPGTCRARPAACPPGAAHDPVCGCDHHVYDGECAAQSAGVDLAVMGGCGGRMPDWIPCGQHFCDVRQDYCAIYLSDVFDLPTDHFCRPLPPSCLPGDGGEARTCDCFPPGTACGSFCRVAVTDGRPGFHLTCQGVTPPR